MKNEKKEKKNKNEYMDLFTEQRITGAVRKLLAGRVNEILSELQYPIPAIEFSDYVNDSVVIPDIALFVCECSEKERIVRIDSYTLLLYFTLPETPESELHCYAYAAAVRKAFDENPTLGGVVNRSVISEIKYRMPDKPHSGSRWCVNLSLRLIVEEL